MKKLLSIGIFLLSLVGVSSAGTVNIACNAVSTQILPNPIITTTDNSGSFVAQYTFRSDSGAYLRELAFASVSTGGQIATNNQLLNSYNLSTIQNNTNPNFTNQSDGNTLVIYYNGNEIGRSVLLNSISYIRNINGGVGIYIPANTSINITIKLVRGLSTSNSTLNLKIIDPNTSSSILEGGAQTLISPENTSNIVTGSCTNRPLPVYLIKTNLIITPLSTSSTIKTILNVGDVIYPAMLESTGGDTVIKKLSFNIASTCDNITSNNFTLKIDGVKYINGTDINCIYNAGKLNCEFIGNYNNGLIIMAGRGSKMGVVVDNSAINISNALSISMSQQSQNANSDNYNTISQNLSSVIWSDQSAISHSLTTNDWYADKRLNIDSFSQTYYNNGGSSCVPIPAVSNTGTISGRYFFDYNLSKTYNTGDGGVDGVNVYLYKYTSNQPSPINPFQLIQTKKTDYYGTYIFTGLDTNSQYQIRFGIMSGFDYTYIYTIGSTPGIAIPNDAVISIYNTNYGIITPSDNNINAGIIKSNTNIYGRYHFDYNANSKYDTGDSGVEGGNIFIYKCYDDFFAPQGINRTFIKQVRTDYYGNYAITGLADGYYVISAGILNSFSKTYSSGMDTCKFFDTNKNYYNYDVGIKKTNCTAPEFIPAYKKFDNIACTLVDCGDNGQVTCSTNGFVCKNGLQNVGGYCKPYTNLNYCVNSYPTVGVIGATTGIYYTIRGIYTQTGLYININTGNLGGKNIDSIQKLDNLIIQESISITGIISKSINHKYQTTPFLFGYNGGAIYTETGLIYTGSYSEAYISKIIVDRICDTGNILKNCQSSDNRTGMEFNFTNTCYNGIPNVQNGGTYSPSTALYTDRKPSTGTLSVDITKGVTTGTQIISTQYGNVQKTITLTGTVIKLLDLNMYVNRSKPAQNEFPDIKAVQEKYTKAMPHVGADMTDAYILAVSSLETANI